MNGERETYIAIDESTGELLVANWYEEVEVSTELYTLRLPAKLEVQ